MCWLWRRQVVGAVTGWRPAMHTRCARDSRLSDAHPTHRMWVVWVSIVGPVVAAYCDRCRVFGRLLHASCQVSVASHSTRCRRLLGGLHTIARAPLLCQARARMAGEAAAALAAGDAALAPPVRPQLARLEKTGLEGPPSAELNELQAMAAFSVYA